MEEILVTGGTGTVGTIVTSYLRSMKQPFRLLTRNPDKARELVGDSVNIVHGDLSDKASLAQAVNGVEKVFMLCPAQPDMDKLEANLIDAAQEAGVTYLMNISAAGADSKSEINLLKKHAATEEKIIASGMDYTILRPHAFMQNTLGSIPSISGENKLYSSLGDAEIPMIDARDIGEVAARMLTNLDEHKGQTYTLTGGKLVSYHDIVNIMSQLLGREIAYIPVEKKDFISALTEAGLPAWLAADLAGMNERWSTGKDIEISDTATTILGRTPRTFGEFMSDYIHFFTGK